MAGSRTSGESWRWWIGGIGVMLVLFILLGIVSAVTGVDCITLPLYILLCSNSN